MCSIDLSREAEIFEDTSLEEAMRTGLSQNLVYFPNNLAICTHHFRESWLRSTPNKGVAQFAHDPFHRAIVDVAIRPVQIVEIFAPGAAWIG